MTGCSSSSATTAAGTSALSTRPGPTRWAGHARSPWQIMADTLVERVTGQTTATAVPVQVHLVLPDRVLLGQAEDAAELHGYGPIPRRARPRAHPRRVRAHELAAAPRHHPGYRPPRRDGLTGLGVPRRNRPADPAPRPGLPHAVVRRPGAHVDHVQAHQDGGPTNETNGQGLCESCNHAKQAAGWHSRIRPGRRHEMETTTPTGHTYRSRAPATWPAAPPLATTGSTSCSAPSSGSPPERRRCRRPRLASDPWQPCCPSCS